MKIIILSSSGNVGKSTISREVLKSNNATYKLFEVEDTNDSSSNYNVDIETFGNNKELMIKIIKEKDFVIDVGSQNLFDILEELKNMKLLNKIDKFIVPTNDSSKEFNDTKKTITLLKNLQVESIKIELLINRVSYEKYLNEEYYYKYFAYAKENNILFDYKNSIYDTGVLKYLSENILTLKELIDDDVDYIKKIEDEDDMELLNKYINMHEIKMISNDLDLHFKNVSKRLLK